MDKNQVLECMYLYELSDGESVYYGLTKNIQKRLYLHKSKGNHCRSNTMDKDKMIISIIEELKDCSYLDCLKKESDMIRNNKDKCINYQVSYQSPAERKEYEKEYYQQNKEHIMAVHKEYYEKNKQKCRKMCLEHYYRNKDHYTEKFVCACGGRYTRRHRSDHMKCKRHIDYLKKVSDCKSFDT